MRLLCINFVLILGLTTASAQSLREAVHQAVAIHPEILLNRAQTLAAQQGITEAQGAYYPKLDVNSAYGSEWTQSPFTQDLAGDSSTTLNRREFNVAAIQNIYSGGAIVGEVDRNIFIFRSQDYKTLGVVNDIALNVTEAYFDVLLQHELVHIAEANLAEHRRLLNLIKERSLAGVARAAELDQADSRYALAESNLYSAQGNQREAMVHFRKAVGSWPDNLVAPAIPSLKVLPKALDQAIREALDNHPRIKSANEDIKQATAQRKISNAAFLPKVDAVFTASRNNNLDGVPGQNNDNVGLIRVSYNLFNGGGDLGHLKKTAYQVQEAFETRNKSMIDLKEKIQLDYNSWYASSRRALVLSNYVVSIDKTKMAYFEQFQIGQRTFLDLLNSQNEAYRSKVDYLGSRRDELIARYRILNSLGRLVPFFARQKDDQGYHRDLFSLPKGKLKIPKVTVQQSPPTTALDGQMIYPTGNTTISSTTISVPNSGSHPEPTDSLTSIASVVPPIPDFNKPPAINQGAYLVELNGFKNVNKAEDMTWLLGKKGLKASVLVKQKNGLSVVYVLVGPYSTMDEANKALDIATHIKKVRGVIRPVTKDVEPSITERK